MKPWIAYTLIRLGVFGAALAFLLVIKVDWPIAAAAAAVIGLCVAYIFFRPQRDAVALELAQARSRRPRASRDDTEEDSVLEDSALKSAALESDRPAEAKPEQ